MNEYVVCLSLPNSDQCPNFNPLFHHSFKAYLHNKAFRVIKLVVVYGGSSGNMCLSFYINCHRYIGYNADLKLSLMLPSYSNETSQTRTSTVLSKCTIVVMSKLLCLNEGHNNCPLVDGHLKILQVHYLFIKFYDF